MAKKDLIKKLEKIEKLKEKKKGLAEKRAKITAVDKNQKLNEGLDGILSKMSTAERKKWQENILPFIGGLIPLVAQVAAIKKSQRIRELFLKLLGQLAKLIGLLFIYERNIGLIQYWSEYGLMGLAEVYSYIRRNLEHFLSLSDFYLYKTEMAFLTGKPFMTYWQAFLSQYKRGYDKFVEINKEIMTAYPTFYVILLSIRATLEELSKTLADTQFTYYELNEEIAQFLKTSFPVVKFTLEIPEFQPLIKDLMIKQSELQSKIRYGMSKGPFYVYFRFPEWVIEMGTIYTIMKGVSLIFDNEQAKKILTALEKVGQGINKIKQILKQLDLAIIGTILNRIELILVKYHLIFTPKITDYLRFIRHHADFIYKKQNILNNEVTAMLSVIAGLLMLMQTDELKQLNKLYEGVKDFFRFEKMDKAEEALDKGEYDKLTKALQNNEQSLLKSEAEFDKERAEALKEAKSFTEQQAINRCVFSAVYSDRNEELIEKSKRPFDNEFFEEYLEYLSKDLKFIYQNKENLKK